MLRRECFRLKAGRRHRRQISGPQGLKDPDSAGRRSSCALSRYTDYFSYLCRSEDHKLPHIARFGERLILAGGCGSPLNTEETEIRITALKTEYQAKGFAYLRQYRYLLPFDDLLNQQWLPDKHFTYCAKTPPGYPFDRDANLIALPLGDYFCRSFRLRRGRRRSATT